MKLGPKTRMLAACVCLAIFFTVFSARLIYLQVVKHDEYTVAAAEKHVNKQIIYAPRGRIQDVNGEDLACNEPVKTVVADGTLITKPGPLADLLAQPLGMDRDKLFEILSAGKPYKVLKKGLPESVANDLVDQMRKLSLRGITFEQDFSRTYPNGTMLSHVIGYMDHTHKGVDGVEKSMEQYLQGSDGFRYTEHDRKGRELVMYRTQDRAAHAGNNVRLTVDMGLQNIVETELDAAIKQFHPKSAAVIMMNPKTGAIMALANRPTYDPNDVGATPIEALKNHAIADMFEPGSIFKIVTISAGFNENVVNPSTIIFCENGRWNYAGKWLRDHKPFGDISVDDILMHSVNVGTAKVAILLGDQRLYEYIRRYGFGEPTGVLLPGEIGGLVHPPHTWSKISITRIPIGQGVGVTAMQAVTAMSAIANGGHLMMPQIVSEITDEHDAQIAAFPPVEVRQVVTQKAAYEVRDALKGVVSKEGTAALAAVPGFIVAGKTGTAQIPIPGGGGYYSDKYVASFVGFMPADNPAFVMLVTIEDPKTGPEGYYGGMVAAPVFSRIAEKAARYLNLVPDATQESQSKMVITQRDRTQRTADRRD